MPICAVVDIKTGRVLGSIVASPSDTPPLGTRLILVSADTDAGAPVDDRWVTAKDGTLVPDQKLQAQRDKEAADDKASADAAAAEKPKE